MRSTSLPFYWHVRSTYTLHWSEYSIFKLKCGKSHKIRFMHIDLAEIFFFSLFSSLFFSIYGPVVVMPANQFSLGQYTDRLHSRIELIYESEIWETECYRVGTSGNIAIYIHAGRVRHAEIECSAAFSPSGVVSDSYSHILLYTLYPLPFTHDRQMRTSRFVTVFTVAISWSIHKYLAILRPDKCTFELRSVRVRVMY